MGKSQGSSQPPGSQEERLSVMADRLASYPGRTRVRGYRSSAIIEARRREPTRKKSQTAPVKLVVSLLEQKWVCHGQVVWAGWQDWTSLEGHEVESRPWQVIFAWEFWGGLSQKESCMVYTEIRNQAENSCVCPYSDLNPVHAISKSPLGEFLCSVLETLWESYQLYPQKKKNCEKDSCLVRGCNAVALSTAAIIACSTNNTEKAWWNLSHNVTQSGFESLIGSLIGS